MSDDDEAVHVYDAGITEGNAPVPLWLLAVLVALFAFGAWFVVTQWSAQPSAARAAR